MIKRMFLNLPITLALGSCFAIFSLSSTAEANKTKVFRNAYVSFEIPDRWNCNLEHTEWICRSQLDKESKEAIIILTAKEVGPTDSYEAYMAHLSKPQTGSARIKGAPSKVIYAPKKIMVNDQTWVDGLQMASEIPNYYTRYLATIKDKIAVLVTFSAHQTHFTKYSQDFFRAVQSLRVIAAKNLLGSPNAALLPANGTLGDTISNAVPANMEGMEAMPGSGDVQGGSTSKTKALLFVVAAILAAGGIFVLMKSRRR